MDRLDALLAELAPAIRRAFEEVIADIVDNVVLKEVIAALEKNDVEAAFRALGITPPVFNPIITALTAAVEQGGVSFMSQFPKYTRDTDGIKTLLRFNIRDPRAEDYIREHSSTLITGIENDTRTAVRTMLDAGLQEGRNPRSVALDLVGRINPETGAREGGTVGLGEREQYWVRSARTKLLTLDPAYLQLGLRDKRFDATVEAAIRAGKPLPLEIVDRLTDRYRANALKHRGETIGRTEAHEAMMHSEWLATSQAMEKSGLPEDAATKTWDARADARTRHSHRELDGQTVTINEPFVSPVTNAKMQYPGDTKLGASGADVIACRCRVIYNVDFLRRSLM